MRFFLIFFFIINFSCKEENLQIELLAENITYPQFIEEVNDTINQNSLLKTCIDGYAGKYPCKNFDLVGYLSLNDLKTSMANDNWGWTDSENGKEYVLIGVLEGTAIVDISLPQTPIYLGLIPSLTESSQWRDIKVYKDYAFIVSEAKDHGLQVFNLKKIKNKLEGDDFKTDFILNDFGSAHNIYINNDSGFAYVFGNNKFFKGGPIFINISNPEKPTIEGGFESKEYVHDAQIVNYRGPDERYFGKEIYVGCHGSQSSENLIVILDVSNKKSPKLISSLTYSNSGFTHQGTFSKDQKYFLLGDELDEINYGSKTKTFIFDLSDLENPVLSFENLGQSNAIDHNGYVNGNLFYLASYTAGLRVYDISDIKNKSIKELGFFDTYPKNNQTAFEGAWSVYPYFQSKNIVISDINSGLFIVKSNK